MLFWSTYDLSSKTTASSPTSDDDEIPSLEKLREMTMCDLAAILGKECVGFNKHSGTVFYYLPA